MTSGASMQRNSGFWENTHVSNTSLYAFNDCHCSQSSLTVTPCRALMSVIVGLMHFLTWIADMKRDETPLMSPAQHAEAAAIGEKLARLRLARRIRQSDAAARAGISRSTASLIEKGDTGRTLAQVLRYLDAVAPGLTLLALLQDEDPALRALKTRETTRRARPLTASELKDLDF